MDLLAQYNTGLSSLLDQHAPIRTKCATLRPTNPWLTDEVLTARRKGRTAKRRWRRLKNTGEALEIDRQIVISLNKEKRRLLDGVKKAYLDKETNKATGKRSLFKIVDAFLIKKPGT